MNNFTKSFKKDLWLRVARSLALCVLIGFGYSVSAQCPMVCNGNVNISMNAECNVEITADIMLQGQGVPGDCIYTIIVMGSNGAPLPTSPFVNASQLGKVLNVKVQNGHNSCWGTITIEDKFPPVINCPADITISCYDNRTFPLPSATDNCGGIVTVKEISNLVVDLDCSEDYSAIRTIIYQAIDLSGNKSPLCTRQIFYERVGLDSVVIPPNRDDIELNAYDCENIEGWDKNGNGYPDISESGVPTTTSGFPIHPNTSYCELNVTYDDKVVEICGAAFKVLRQWVIMDWCSGEVILPYQIIKVLDKTPPIADCDYPIAVISARSYDCSADWIVAPPKNIEDCSDVTYTVSYYYIGADGPIPGNVIYSTVGVVGLGNGYIIKGLKAGFTWVRYRLEDACGNVFLCYRKVQVIDNVAPTAVCDEFTVVTLSNNGLATVFATSFDDGSHDNCSDLTYHVRRMTPGCSQSTTQWKESVGFCCADVGKEIMVSLRVTDISGNTNTCMVIVTVQDKKPPVITCPDDITINCGTDYTNVNITGKATATDNCGPPVITYTDSLDLNKCGRGIVYRRWKATDKGNLMDTCIQIITIVDSFPFSDDYIDWTPVRDTIIYGCTDVDIHPDSTGYPKWDKDHCKLIAANYEDQVYTFVEGVCLKILRK